MSDLETLALRVIIAAGALVDLKDDPESLRQAIDLLAVCVKEHDEAFFAQERMLEAAGIPT
jgi:hypothetical protein